MIDLQQLKAEMEEEEQEVESSIMKPISMLREFDDPATSASGAVGATMIGVVGYDAIKHGRGDESERLFQGGTGWALAIGGSLLLGLSLGRLYRGKKAQLEAEEWAKMIEKIQEKTEEEEEEKEKKEAEQQQKINNNRMMLTHPNSFSPVPINFGLNAGIGEYGSAIGQSLLSYHHNL